MRDILVITNVQAGTHEVERLESAVAVLEKSHQVEVVATCDQEELDAAVDNLGERDVVVAGGDGSLHALVVTLNAHGVLDRPTLGLIPLGTGNDFARGAFIPLDPELAADVIVAGRSKAIDVFVEQEAGDLVVNSAHIGVGVEAAQHAVPWKARLGRVGLGRVGYAIGAVIAGFTTEGHRLRVVADGVVLANGRRRVLQVGIGNGSRVGGGAELTPDADPTDAKAEVLVSFAVKPLDRLQYGLHLRRGTHDERRDVRVVRASSVEITGRDFWCNADGEVTGPFQRRLWTVRPGAFTMRLPTPDQARESFPAPRVGAGKSYGEPVSE